MCKQALKFKKFAKCEAGTSLIVVALALTMLLIIAGVVLDIGRMYAVQAKAQNAADAALLGAVATRDSNGTTPDEESVTVNAEMANLFKANYPANYLGSTVAAISVTQISPGVWEAIFNVTLPGFMPSNILNDGPQTYRIISQVTVGIPTADAKLEIALVLDNTGSMVQSIDSSGESKIAALQTASDDLVDILFGGSSTLNNLHVSIVPYNIVVQIGTGHDSWIQSYPADIPLPVNGVPGTVGLPPPTAAGEETNNTNSLPKYQALEAGTLTGGVPKGFAGNRFTDFLCGPYFAGYTDWPPVVCTGFVPVCTTCDGFVSSCTTCDGFTPTCYPSCDTETGVCTTSCTTCTPSCTSCPTPSCSTCTPSAEYFAPNYTNVCTPNGLNDVDDMPPTSGPQYQFRLPIEAFYTPATENPASTWPGNNEDHTWTSTLAPLLFASNSNTAVHTAISAMQPGGDTRINVGMMWGWFTLSPKWQGLWDGSSLPEPFSPLLSKVMVLMTDGENVFPGDDDTTLAMCTAIKNSGITIYTVGLGAPGELNQTLLQQCATKPTYYFNAPTTAQLQTVFHQIGDTVTSNLTERLSQ